MNDPKEILSAHTKKEYSQNLQIKRLGIGLLVLSIAILTLTIFSLAILWNTFSIDKTEAFVAFDQPSPSTDVSIPPDIMAMKNEIDNFGAVSSCFLFANTYTLDGNDLYRYFNESNATSIALANGLVLPNDISLPNRVLLVLPLNSNYQTAPLSSALKYESRNNMCQTQCAFDDENLMVTPTPEGTALPSLPVGDISTAGTARYMMNNYKNYRYTDSVRSVIILRNDLDALLRPVPGRVAGSAQTSTYNLRVYHGLDSRGTRNIYLAAINKETGMVTNVTCKKLGPKSMCPNNCDFK